MLPPTVAFRYARHLLINIIHYFYEPQKASRPAAGGSNGLVKMQRPNKRMRSVRSLGGTTSCQKARSLGMSYPRTGIMGKKHSVTEKYQYLQAWIEKNPPNNQSEEKADEWSWVERSIRPCHELVERKFQLVYLRQKDHLHKSAKWNHRSERCFWNFWNRTNSREVRAVKPSLQERYKKLSQDLVQSQSWNPDELAQNSI